MLKKRKSNALSVAHIGATAIENPFAANDSSSRGAMSRSMNTQRPVHVTTEPAHVQSISSPYMFDSGFHKRAPCDLIVTGIFSIPHPSSWETSITYVSRENGEYGVIVIPYRFSINSKFGFHYVATEVMRNLKVNEWLEKGEILATSPNYRDGEYLPTVNLMTAKMSHRGAAEDGVMLSESAIKKLGILMYQEITIDIAQGDIWRNIGTPGSTGEFKGIPDVGDEIPDDLIICSILKNKLEDTPVQSTKKYASEINYQTDKIYQTRGQSYDNKAKVVSIDVIKGNGKNDTGMFAQLDRYAAIRTAYQVGHLDHYYKYRKRAAAMGETTMESHVYKDLLIEASILNNKNGKPVKVTVKKDPLPMYKVTLVIEKVVYPYYGSKVNTQHAAKGVVTAIVPDDNMPIDETGRRAEMIMLSQAIPNRTIAGDPLEHYVADAGSRLGEKIRKMLGVDKPSKDSRKVRRFVRDLMKTRATDPLVNEILEMLHRFYMIVNYVQAEGLKVYWDDDSVMGDVIHEIILYDVISRIIVDIMPEEGADKIILNLYDSEFRTHSGMVSWIGLEGKPITSKSPIVIAPMAVYMLEKLPDNWTASNTIRQNTFGISAVSRKDDMNITPCSANAGVSACQDSTCTMSAMMSTEDLAEQINRLSSPTTVATYTKNILTEPNSFSKDNIIDRSLPGNQIDNGIVLSLLNHVLACGGAKFAYEPCKHTEK